MIPKSISHLFNILFNLQRSYEFHKSRLYDIKHYPSRKTLRKLQEIRKKDKITVAFLVYDISKWKSEALYLELSNYSRFDPVIIPVMCFHGDYLESSRQFTNCIEYLNDKGYKYIIGNPNIDIDNLVKPDIVFYGELYEGLFNDCYSFRYNSKRESLSCYIPYCFHNTNIEATLNHLENNLVWLSFVENEETLEDIKAVMTNKGVNLIATGLPIQDSFIAATKNFRDIWKPQTKRKKRIIWAPSHTIVGNNIENAYKQSTFLEVADDILIIAEKYKDSIQWAFKPHPVLRRKLIKIWGLQATDAYYEKWANLEYSQLEEGQYVDLFMGSDAMIHDCMSFMVEYMYVGKPVLFLNNGINNTEIYNTQTAEAYNIHYKANSINEIEKFILQTVLGNEDPLNKKRLKFKQKFLIPPMGRTACENIIAAILGS